MAGMTIRVEGLSRLFVGGGAEVWAVRNVTMDVEPGEFLAVIGRSGSGKTTLLNLIAGLERPTHGAVLLDGEDITHYAERQLTELRRRRIGFVFQSFGLLPLLSALENVELPLRIAGAGRRDRIRRSHEVLEMMGLTKRMHHRPYELSGGEQQRVAIARAIANRPALILADEPTGELDSVTGRQIFRALREVARAEGITIVTSTHDRTVMELASRVEELADGRLLASSQQTLLGYTTARGQVHSGTAAPETPLSFPVASSVAAATTVQPVPAAEMTAEEPPPEAPVVPDAEPEPAVADINRWAPPERRQG